MSSLNDRFSGAFGSSPADEASRGGFRASDDGFLANSLWILRRRFQRYLNNAKPVRAGIGSALALGFMTCGLLLGAVTGGHGPTLVSNFAGSVGLQATDIVISGQIETREQDVFDALGLSPNRSLVGFDANSARERIAALPWIESVTVRKLYPGQLLVEMREKHAFAVWQKDEHLSVVQKDGTLISRFGISDLLNNRFSHLPHLVGEGAAEAAAEILPIAAQFPSISGRVQSYSRVANRRWNINLDGGLVIKLPENGLEDAIKILASMQEERRVLDRQISSIDLRISGRIAMRLSPEAATLRAKFVADRAKAMKKAEQNL